MTIWNAHSAVNRSHDFVLLDNNSHPDLCRALLRGNRLGCAQTPPHRLTVSTRRAKSLLRVFPGIFRHSQ
jgi:hypothetical protein